VRDECKSLDLNMQNDVQGFKRQFIRTLDPFLDMFLIKQLTMAPTDWISMIHKLETGIRLHSDQYLGLPLPSQEITLNIIREIFEDFIRDNPFPQLKRELT